MRDKLTSSGFDISACDARYMCITTEVQTLEGDLQQSGSEIPGHSHMPHILINTA